MKKVLLSLAFVLAIGSSAVNASSSDEIISTTSTENIEIVEDFGCARDCVDEAIDFVTWAADGEDLNSDPIYLWAYKQHYIDCYNTKCL